MLIFLKRFAIPNIFDVHRPLSIGFSYMQPCPLDMAPGWGLRSIYWMILILKFLVYVLDAYISKTIQDTCLIFGIDLS